MTELFLILIFIGPLIGILIWSYKNPKESILWGRRWAYKEEPKITEGAISYVKFTSMIGIGILILTIFIILIESRR